MQQKHETCPKTIKQWWHEMYILSRELRAPNMYALCSLRHFFFFSQCPPNNKPVVENKAYSLPGGVIKLMTPKTGSVHTEKQSFMERWVTFQNERLSLCWDLKLFFQSAMTVLAWPYKDKKTSLPYLREELMMETWHLLKKDKDLLPFPLASSDLKNVTHWVPRAAQCLIPLVKLTSILF